MLLIRSLLEFSRLLQSIRELLSIEDIVTEHEGNLIISDELFSNNKGFCESARFFLN
jgi:hypothetical protein